MDFESEGSHSTSNSSSSKYLMVVSEGLNSPKDDPEGEKVKIGVVVSF
jgi:hypothetical protein